MENLRKAIARVGAQVKTLDLLRERKFKKSVLLLKKRVDKHETMENRKESMHYAAEFKDLVRNHEKQRYREFLKPVEMNSLKIFRDDKIPYKLESAKHRWMVENTTNSLAIYESFVDNQNHFNKIIDLLIELTPETLFPKTDYNYNKIINDYESSRSRLKYDVPKYYFKPVPQFNEITSIKQFEEYIYTLTNTKFLFNNASSMNGVVNDILLYTHNLDNTNFKRLRTVNTYNNLIKWYGYDKNQGLFARSILISMKKDGVDPNIETINTLLKSMRLGIRGYSNKYMLIVQYLQLCKQYGLKTDLVTWSRIYALLGNVYLKEIFLNKISIMNLPITKELIYLIVDDYMKFGTDIESFIETDLKLNEWKNDSKLVNKVNYFKIVNGGKISNNNKDDHGLQYVLKGIKDSRLPDNIKVETMIKILNNSDPQCFRIVFSELNKIKFDIKTISEVTNHLLYKFNEVTKYNNYREDIRTLKYFIRDFYVLETKLKFFNYKIKPQLIEHIENIKFDPESDFEIPDNIFKKQFNSKINKMNYKRFSSYSSTIETRLKKQQYL